MDSDKKPNKYGETQLDGLTTVFMVVANVTPNEINHIKIAIADASDSVLDSDVFIKSGSFTDDPEIPSSSQSSSSSSSIESSSSS
ncbi:MAG: choice-of-anchor L domain-containing protein, partial [Gammaproteobacteria bacterium]|nr:choice-of-anchor L domain-containing protein [Gammaproteobacteria bacterium]